jgi:hypothetical protein
MSIAQGSRRQILYVAESEWGVRETTPQMTVLRNTGGGGIAVDRSPQQSAEFRSDRAITDVRLGVQRATFPIPFELTWETYDDFLAAALFGDWSTGVLKQGTTAHFFDLEEGFTDIAVYLTMIGAMVDTFTLSLQPEGRIITGQFGFIGRKLIDPETSSGDATPTAANSNPPFDSFTGFIKKDLVAIGVATSLDLSVANNLAAHYILFDDEASGMGAGRANITGTLNAYFTGKDEIEEFLAEDECALQFELEDLDGNTYLVDLPRVKWTGNTRNVAENEITQAMPFQALYDETEETAMKITATAASS